MSTKGEIIVSFFYFLNTVIFNIDSSRSVPIVSKILSDFSSDDLQTSNRIQFLFNARGDSNLRDRYKFVLLFYEIITASTISGQIVCSIARFL